MQGIIFPATAYWMRARLFLTIVPWILIIVGTVSRFILPFYTNPLDQLWSDWQTHWLLANSPVLHDPQSGNIPILFHIWLSIVFRVTNADWTMVAVYAGLLSALTPWLWFRWIREVVSSRPLALYGWAIFALLPSWIGIYSYFMTETLLLPMLGLALWFSWRNYRKQTKESLVWSTLIWLLTAITKGTAVPVAFMCLGWSLYRSRQRLRDLAIVVPMTVFFLTPLCIRSYKLVGAIAPFGFSTYDRVYFESGKETVQVRFAHPGDTGGWVFANSSASLYFKPFWPFSEWPNSRQGKCEIFIDVDNKPASWAQALADNTGDINQRLRNHFENFVFMLWSPSWPNQFEGFFWDWLANWMRWLWAPLLLVVVVSNCYYMKKNRQIIFLGILNMAAWGLLVTMPMGVGEGRYRKAYEGLLIVNALLLVDMRFRRGKRDTQDSTLTPA